MDSVIRKTKIDNIVSGDIIDNLKKLKDDASFNEEAMFDNKFSVANTDKKQNIIDVSDEFTKEEDYVKLYKKCNVRLILNTVIIPILSVIFIVFSILLFHFDIVRSYILLFIFVVVPIGIACVTSGGEQSSEETIRDNFKKYDNFEKSRYKTYKEEVDEKRLSIRSNFVNPKIIRKYDELFLVLKKMTTESKDFYKESDFKSNIMDELLSCGVLAKVQFNGKDTWIPENKKINKDVEKYEYDTPSYAVTNNAINVFIDDGGIAKALFDEMNENKDGLIPVAILANDESAKYVLDILVMMNVLSIRYFSHINENVVEFGPRYKDYLAYIEQGE